MRVFISWSGEPSRLVAEALRDWLRAVLQAVQPWMSAKDIDKGARWSTEIANELDQAKVGIVCLTPLNLQEPWILFESGALSKQLGKSLVCPYLLGVQPTDLEGPLVQFQAAVANEKDTLTLLETVNRALGDQALPEATLHKVFQKWWPDLEQQLSAINLGAQGISVVRGEREMIEETLSLVRQLVRDRTESAAWLSSYTLHEPDIDRAIAFLRLELAGGKDMSPEFQKLYRNLLRRSLFERHRVRGERQGVQEPAAGELEPSGSELGASESSQYDKPRYPEPHDR